MHTVQVHIDDHFISTVRSWTGRTAETPLLATDPVRLLTMFDAQIQSRHLDFASRWLQSQGEGFYTIGSAGHEANAAVGLALRHTDPALLHYRSGGFYAARASQVPNSTPINDVLHGVGALTSDAISGGRHKVFGNKSLNVIPQTSTIGSHVPRAFGLAYALGRRDASEFSQWPADSIVVCSVGDASINHSTTVGALNAAGYLAHQRAPVPLLLVCEDNGIGISTPSPAGWTERALSTRPGWAYFHADAQDPQALLAIADEAAQFVRTKRQPAILHLRTVRLMGHAGSDAEVAYRTSTEIEADFARDPLLTTARYLVDAGILTPDDVLDRYEAFRQTVMDRAKTVVGGPRLTNAARITGPIVHRRPGKTHQTASVASADRASVFGRLPESEVGLTLAQTINATLTDILAAHPSALIFGEDVARKGGVYGVTGALRKRFGAARVFDTLLDEQTILGTALGLALAGHVPIPEIQYLAYLHNAEDQLRGEAATLGFFSNGQYRNPMVVRIAGLAYQKGFGGHFHNDNSLAVLRDIPGVAVAVPSHPAGAAALLRHCVASAIEEGRVCVFVEPIALYHRRDLYQDGDNLWLAPYAPPEAWPNDGGSAMGNVRTYGTGSNLAIVTFGNGVPMSLRAAPTLEADGIGCTVIDLQWVSPLPLEALIEAVGGFDQVLVADETRASGGVSEAVVTGLIDAGYRGTIARVTSEDSFIPLGPAADAVLLSENDIVAAARRLVG